MTLQELTTRLQSLCHDGYAQSDVLMQVDIGFRIRPEEIKLLFKSEASSDGIIIVKLGED